MWNSLDALALSKKSAAKTTVVKLILDYLKQEGVTHIFGLPGGPITPLFDALYDEALIQTISTRHEAGAAFMAAGYARLSGRLGVCCATTGPGTTNLITAVAAAKADSLPLLVLTAQAATLTFGKGSLQDSTYDRIDVVSMLKETTKLSCMAVNPHNLGTTLRQAIRTAMSGRRGPVHLNIPTDIMKKEIEGGLWFPHQYRAFSKLFDREAVRQAVCYLLEASHPAILAGHGINLSGASQELLELAELLNIPVATTPKAKGAFPENHPLALRVFGLASSPLAEKYLLSEKVDVLLVLGSNLHEISTQGWDSRLNPKTAFIQQDIDPLSIGRNYPVTLAIIGDAKTTLREMIFQIKRQLALREHLAPRNLEDFFLWKKTIPPWINNEALQSQALPLKPQRLMGDLLQCLPENAALFIDSGNNTLWALHYLQATGKNCFVHNWGDFGAMGFGVATAIGGKLAEPARPAIAIVGDGAFAMIGMEVLTAVTYNIAVVWIVLNDGRFNAVHHGQQIQYKGRTIGTEFHRMDIAKLAESLGAIGIRVEKPNQIQEILPSLLKENKPAVIDAIIDPNEVPPIESRFKSLEEFFFKT